jgi:plastocyanin
MTTTPRSDSGRSKLALLLTVAAFLLALAGLSGEAASAGDATAQASRSATVTINHFAFHPPTLTIGAGSKVVFSNTSGITHTATRRGSFNTGRIKPGTSVAVRFAQKGTFAYHCSIHPFMHGKIVVQ